MITVLPLTSPFPPLFTFTFFLYFHFYFYFLSIMITVLLPFTYPFPPIFTFTFLCYFTFTFTLIFIHHDHRPALYFPLSFLNPLILLLLSQSNEYTIPPSVTLSIALAKCQNSLHVMQNFVCLNLCNLPQES